MQGRPRTEERLDAVVNVRLSAEEKARLAEDARTAGVSMSALVRRRYFGRPLVAKADQVVIRELRRVGGLLKAIHMESGGAYKEATWAAINEVAAAIRRLASVDR